MLAKVKRKDCYSSFCVCSSAGGLRAGKGYENHAEQASRTLHTGVGAEPRGKASSVSARDKMATVLPQLLICIILICCLCTVQSLVESSVLDKLEQAITVTKSTLASIKEEWQVDKLPYFLKSCYMHKQSWELMKLKYEKKILAAIAPGASGVKFVISFTGR
jgi:hypothetical protein